MTTSSLYQIIAGYLDDADRHYDCEPEGGLIVVEIGGDHGNWKMFVQITDDDEARRVVIHAKLPARIPEGNRRKVAELLTRINYDLIVGNFELGFDDGEVLFKTTLDLADGQLTQAMFERMYMLNAQIVNEYFAQILSDGFGELELADGSEMRRREGSLFH